MFSKQVLIIVAFYFLKYLLKCSILLGQFLLLPADKLRVQRWNYIQRVKLKNNWVSLQSSSLVAYSRFCSRLKFTSYFIDLPWHQIGVWSKIEGFSSLALTRSFVIFRGGGWAVGAARHSREQPKLSWGQPMSNRSIRESYRRSPEAFVSNRRACRHYIRWFVRFVGCWLCFVTKCLFAKMWISVVAIVTNPFCPPPPPKKKNNTIFFFQNF